MSARSAGREGGVKSMYASCVRGLQFCQRLTGVEQARLEGLAGNLPACAIIWQHHTVQLVEPVLTMTDLNNSTDGASSCLQPKACELL